MEDRFVEFSNEAELEFHKVKCYMDYIGKSEEFWKEVNQQIEYIRQYPEAFQVRYKMIRIVFLKKFDYSIHYTIKSKGIVVYRFLQKSQEF
ncbi:hypothetical protein [Winogradskyella immobilis]|uniref:Type II toxin-antitoxin system RelE/ParE family toxin n=1 Tax=Winogradskyella immobilis TaxID=2816852 RepID=A0ABS8EJH2_9FLAO|nr:hypothetical protein [Winogradskyella immobilis]MCC1483116.1 hypothetical protein [Winogradskyella immobilis]MCG0015211.1 hypothetical protein [Winogradskyella immobilis]